MAGERKFITENIRRVLVKEYFMKETKRAGFGGIDIQRTPMGTRVTLMTERPGLVIGRRGSTIKTLTNAVEFKFKFDKPQIEVVEVDNPNLNAQIMAEKLAAALERGWHFRRAGHSTVRRILSAGARGCQVIISGKLTGQRHRMEKFKEGHIKFCGEPKLKWMEEGFAIAKLKQGVIGVKVQIMNPNAKLSDEVSIIVPDEDIKPEVTETEKTPEEDKKEVLEEQPPSTEKPEEEIEADSKPKSPVTEPKEDEIDVAEEQPTVPDKPGKVGEPDKKSKPAVPEPVEETSKEPESPASEPEPEKPAEKDKAEKEPESPASEPEPEKPAEKDKAEKEPESPAPEPQPQETDEEPTVENVEEPPKEEGKDEDVQDGSVEKIEESPEIKEEKSEEAKDDPVEKVKEDEDGSS